jgi:hypothetical protein
LRCASLPIALNTARRFPSRLPKFFRWHEPLEISQSEATFSCFASNRLGGRVAERFARRLKRSGWASLSRTC